MNTIKNVVTRFSTVITYNTISKALINEFMRKSFASAVKIKVTPTVN
ncbi:MULTISPECIES: hypothetical protein [Flavobacterium]|nr:MULTISPECIES: hypothetical protein [Flavobacterium]